MLDRNRRIKQKPERFQENKDEFDLIVTCQERVFDQVLESEYTCSLIFDIFVWVGVLRCKSNCRETPTAKKNLMRKVTKLLFRFE